MDNSRLFKKILRWRRIFTVRIILWQKSPVRPCSGPPFHLHQVVARTVYPAIPAASTLC